METRIVWTRQHKNVLKNLEETGRHVATREAIHQNEEAMTMLPAYDWLAQAIPDQESRPPDAAYPIWLSFRQETTMLTTPGTVLLELEIPQRCITKLRISHWGAVNNDSYIPLDEADLAAHRREMKAYGLSDAQACMSRFYPELREKIQRSWDRIFQTDGAEPLSAYYGLVWELKKEWIRTITQ